MTSLSLSALRLKAALYLLLLLVPACMSACPRSCSCLNPREVHCTFRHLQTPPSNLPKDTQRINLGYNSIATVGSSDFANLRQLEMLMLHGNDINSVTSRSFYHLRSLQILKLSYNKLKVVDPGIFKGLTRLVRLYLDHNLISFIQPFSFNGLTSLKLLQLESNQLQDLHPHSFTTISFLGTFWGSGLRHLHLADNQLEYLLPETLRYMSRLEFLSLHSNPWTCDCNLHWLLEWNKKHEGVIQCKNERIKNDSVANESCATCASPQHLNSSQILQLSSQQLPCDRPSITSPMKLKENSAFEDQEQDLPYIKDLEQPLGNLALMLSDSHGNRAHVTCDVIRLVEGTSMVWEKVRHSEGLVVNVTLLTQLECEIDRESLQNLWRLVAYYYESPAILERGARHENTSKVTFQYSQVTVEDSPYFTELKGYLMAEPAWLLQPKITIQLNRRRTTSKKLVMTYSTFISKHVSRGEEHENTVLSWALIRRGTPERIQIVLEHSDVNLTCNILSSGHQSIEWMLPDLTTLDQMDSHRIVSEHNYLVIKNTSLTDSGLYHCFVRTGTGIDIVPYRLMVRERLLSPNNINGKKMFVEYGKSISLPCLLISPQPTVTRWILPNHQLVKASNEIRRIYADKNNTLIIKKAMHKDDGEYSCLAANLHGVNMLSHQVVVTGETTENPTDAPAVKSTSQLYDTEDTEGSGYQETRQLAVNQTSQRVVGKYRGGLYQEKIKGTKVKEKKPNKSVKELDPGRWAQILAKANAKVSVMQLSTMMTFADTKAVETTTTTTVSTTTAYKATTDYISTRGTTVKNYSIKQLVQPNLRESTGHKSVQTQHLNRKTDYSNIPNLPSVNLYPTTLSPIKSNLENVTHSEKQTGRHIPDKIIRANNSRIPNSRRRVPFRRRPLSRKLHPQKPTRPPETTTGVAITTPLTTPAPESITSTSKSFTDSDIKSNHAFYIKDNFSITRPDSFIIPVHPWLTQRRNQILTTLRPYTASPIWTYSHIPVWPRVHGSGHHSSLDMNWHLLHTSGRDTEFTNKPEITAATANPTFWSKTAAPHDDSSSQAKDYLLLQKLRNRYRQSRLNGHRLYQLEKVVTTKPRMYHPTPIPHPPPNFSEKLKPVTPHFTVVGTSQPAFTVSILQSSRWHYNHFGSKIQSTALPFPKLIGSGVKPRIRTSDEVTVSALAEMNVLLRCQATGDPKPVISWTKVSTGATIQASTKYGQRFEVLSNGTFVIKNVQLQDRGQYLCTAQNTFGSDRMVVNLAVQTEPPKINGPKYQDVSVYLGKSVSLDCIALGRPQAQVSWILPNRTFVREVMSLGRSISLFPNGTLTIYSANFSSKGDYKCIASNAAGADTLTYHLHVAALPPAISEESSEHIPVIIGRSIYVHCTAKGEPEPLLKWILPDNLQLKPTQFFGRRLFIFPNGTLYIKSIMSSDAGRYECTATNMVGFAQRVVKLDIRQESSGSWQGPSQQHSVSAIYGSTVFLHCPESESHRGTVWRLPSKTLLDHRYSPQRHIVAFANGTLKILQVTEKDGGNYLCMYQRPNGEDMELFQLTVLMKPPKIENMSSKEKKVTNGENFLMDCVASGLPDPEVSWSLPDGTMINNALQSDDSGTRSRRHFIFENGTLLLQRMGESDEGDYTCYAKNTLGEDAMKVTIQVVSNFPKISSKDQVSLHAVLGESAQMKCDARDEAPLTIIWILPNNEIITSSTAKYQMLYDGTLIINKVTLTDQGKYTCVVRNSAGNDIKIIKLQVDATEPNINGKKGQSKNRVLAVSYQTILLHCEAEGIPKPQIVWTTSSDMSLPMPYVAGRFQVHKNGTLEIRGIRKTDEGQFLCVAKNYLGEASLAIELEVASLAEKPSFLMPNIEFFSLKPDDTYSLTLDCQAIGKPKPEFIWILPNSTALAPGMKLERFVHSPENGTLHIIKPVPSDKGVYRCLAKNIAGQAEKRYTLETGRKPQIRGTAAPMKISLGQIVNMPCTVEGWHQASITWTLPNGLLLDRPQVFGRVMFLSNGTLQLQGAAKSDRGTYTCKATNTFGSSTLSYPVTIMVFPPQITNAPPSITRAPKGSPVTLKCIASGIPKPDISWTLPGRTTLVPNNRYTMSGIYMTEGGSLVIQDPSLMNSGIYKCNAKNALGMDFKATYLQVI